MMLLMVILFFVGLLTGVLYGKMLYKSAEPIGDLRIVNTDPDEPPYMFLEVVKTPDKLKHGDVITLKVNTKKYDSQK